MISSSNSLSRGSGMLHQVDDAFTARHVRYRAVPRTNRTPATSSRAYQSKSARVERAGIVMQSSGLLYLLTFAVECHQTIQKSAWKFTANLDWDSGSSRVWGELGFERLVTECGQDRRNSSSAFSSAEWTTIRPIAMRTGWLASGRRVNAARTPGCPSESSASV